MRTILIEDSIYKVSEREFKVIKKMEQDLKDLATSHYSLQFEAEDKLSQYLEASKILYKFVGTVDFQYQV